MNINFIKFAQRRAMQAELVVSAMPWFCPTMRKGLRTVGAFTERGLWTWRRPSNVCANILDFQSASLGTNLLRSEDPHPLFTTEVYTCFTEGRGQRQMGRNELLEK